MTTNSSRREVFLGLDVGTQGARVVAMIQAGGGDAVFVRADVTQKDGNDGLLAGALAAFGRVDIVVLNAGIASFGPLTEHKQSAWDEQIATNLTSVWHGLRAFVPTLRSAGGGAIVVTTTIAGEIGMAGTAAYAASKGAIEALTKTLASHYASEQIRVNAVSPGLTRTPMSRRAQSDETILNFLKHQQPLAPEMVRPESVARLALFLLSADASEITGQVVAADGGWSVR